MLTEKRYSEILKLIEEKKSVTVNELKELLNTSESTIRRDITALDKMGKLTKVFGGAIAITDNIILNEPTVSQKNKMNLEEKNRIAKFAAGLIQPNDFVYIDAGTTTACMLQYITENKATYVTNAFSHAKVLADKGKEVIIIGGNFKSSTEAIIGSVAVAMLNQYHFTKAFFGANGISKELGFTTPDAIEAMTKKVAFEHCKMGYVLADHTKFGQISNVSFGDFNRALVITDQVIEEYKNCDNVVVIE